MDMQVRRTRRFERSLSPARIELGGRDIEILRHVARHRFMSSARLIALDGGNASNVLTRLRRLYDHGYLDRPPAQLNHVPWNGPKPMVYALAPRGAAALRDQGDDVARVDWTEKNRRAGAVFIQHTLGIAHFLTTLELACRDTGGLAANGLAVCDADLIRQTDILAAAPEATRSARYPLRWTVRKMVDGQHRHLSVVPDALFGLRFEIGNEQFETFFIFELDRGTIPIERASSDHRSIRRKLEAYYEGWRTRRHVEQLGFENVRVLFLTTSPTRVENMLATVDHITAGRGTGFFLFGDQVSLADRNPLEFEWISGRHEKLRLTD